MYIEDLLEKNLNFEFKHVGAKWGVYEKVRKEDVLLSVGCVFIGTAPECRAYVQERKSKQAVREEEQRGRNPLIEFYDRRYASKGRDGVIR